MNAGKMVDGVTWWLAGWRPGPRPAVGTAVTLAVSGALAAFWGYLPTLHQRWPLLQAIEGLLLRLGMAPDWRPVLYALCLVGALAQTAIAAVDLFAPAAVRLRAGARAFADLAAGLFAGAVVLAFGLDPRQAFDPDAWLGGWIAFMFCVVGVSQVVRGLANLRQATRPAAAAVA